MKIMIFLVIVLYTVAPEVTWGQISKSGDPQYPDNYTAMENFNLGSGYNSPTSPMQMYFKRLPGVSPDYQLGPEDVIKIDVMGNESFSQTCKISNSGYISFPFLGDIQVKDLTAEELEREIAARLRDHQLIKNPEILVYIESYSSKPVAVLGDVDLPGVYMITQHLTLMDLVLMAGGLDISADSHGFLHRRTQNDDTIKPQTGKLPMLNISIDRISRQDTIIKNPEIGEPGTEVIRIDLEPAKTGGFVEPNLPLKAGDVFIVPRRNIRLFYVIGDVLKPGAYKIDQGAPLLISQAISHAGGPAKTAKAKNGLLVRYDQNGERHESKVDYYAILRGTQKDLEVLADDIIFIPGSNAKTLAYGLLGVIPNAIPTQVNQSID